MPFEKGRSGNIVTHGSGPDDPAVAPAAGGSRDRVVDRRAFIAAAAGSLLAAPLAAEAQAGKVWRIGFLGVADAARFARGVEAVRLGLRDHGYVEGRNITIEFRWAEGRYDRLPELAAELVRLKVDVIITHGTPGTLALKGTTSTIPIVMSIIGNPIESGAGASLARPGSNITGSSFFSNEVTAKLGDPEDGAAGPGARGYSDQQPEYSDGQYQPNGGVMGAEAQRPGSDRGRAQSRRARRCSHGGQGANRRDSAG